MTQLEIKNKILAGGKLAIERLIERKRKEDAYVIISEKGKVSKIKARDLTK